MTSIVMAAMLATSQENYSMQTTNAFLSKIEKAYEQKLCAAGTIRLTVDVPQQDRMIIDTNLQYLRPGRIYIYQKQKVGKGKSQFMVSDGKVFKYIPRPLSSWTTAKDYYVELVRKRDGSFQTVEEMYLAGAQGVMDRSIPLDIIMAGKLGVTDARKLLAGSIRAEDAEVGGVKCEMYTGRFRPGHTQAPIFWFELAMTPGGELKRFRTQESIQANTGAPVKVNWTWEVDVAINDETKVDKKYFKVP